MSHRTISKRAFRSGLALPLFAVTALVAVAAGCGGGEETLTKAQVIEQGGAFCKRAEQAVERLPQIKIEHPFAKGTSAAEQQGAREFLAGYANALESSRVGLQGLNAPEQDQQLLEGYISDLGTIIAKFRTASKAEAAKVEAQAMEAFALFDKASKQTADYGFPKGVCGSGSST
jgi:hypothetical protein